MENTELSMICRFVKLLVNEVKFLAVKTGWLVNCAKSNSNIRRIICKCKHVCNVNMFHASRWCQFQRNPHFKRPYASPKSNFSQFWRHLLTEPLPDILTDFLILFLKSRVDNLEEGYTIYAGVLYLHNGFLQWNERFRDFLSSTLWNPKETEYKAEDINGELAHPLFDV